MREQIAEHAVTVRSYVVRESQKGDEGMVQCLACPGQGDPLEQLRVEVVDGQEAADGTAVTDRDDLLERPLVPQRGDAAHGAAPLQNVEAVESDSADERAVEHRGELEARRLRLVEGDHGVQIRLGGPAPEPLTPAA